MQGRKHAAAPVTRYSHELVAIHACDTAARAALHRLQVSSSEISLSDCDGHVKEGSRHVT